MKPSQIAKFIARETWDDANPFSIAPGVYLSTGGIRPGLVVVPDASHLPPPVLQAAFWCDYVEYVGMRAKRLTWLGGYEPDSRAIVRCVGAEMAEMLIASENLRTMVAIEVAGFPVSEAEVRAVVGQDFLSAFVEQLKVA